VERYSLTRGSTELNSILPQGTIGGVEMTTRDDPNHAVIQEFRSSAGKVGGYFEGAPVLLLHTIGAKTNKTRITPLMYLPDGDRWVVFASKAGAPTNPDWFHNLVVNPDVRIEVGMETIDVRATVASPEERGSLYPRQVAAYPQYGEYENMTSRKIPVVVLSRRS